MENEIPLKIKQLRTQKGLTLEQLAKRIGCSKSYISQLEKGVTAPSVSMLAKLAEALGFPVSDFFLSPVAPRIQNWYLSKSERRAIHYPDGKVQSQLLTRSIFQKKMQPLVSVIQPGGSSDRAAGQLVHPPGSEEFVLVLSGEVTFEIETEEILLKEGDTLYFNGEHPHRWSNKGKKTAEVLFVWTPPVW